MCSPSFSNPLDTSPRSIKGRAYVVPPEVFLIAVGTENRMQAGGLLPACNSF